jgi:NADH-quinone oxidoreductase subunit A
MVPLGCIYGSHFIRIGVFLRRCVFHKGYYSSMVEFTTVTCGMRVRFSLVTLYSGFGFTVLDRLILLNLDFIIFLTCGVMSFAVSVILVALNKIVSRVYYGREKLSPYECGFQPSDTVDVAYDIHFYRVGILFLIFDVELVFFFPCVWHSSVCYSGFTAIFVFITVLIAGFVFEYSRGFLDWIQI